MPSPYQTPLVYRYDSGDYEGCLDAALRLADYDAFEERRARSRSQGKLRGIGLSAYVEACGIGPSKLRASLGGGGGMWESCEIRVQPGGSVEVLTGAHNHGQGHHTVYSQIVAERFGIPMNRVTVIQGDTDRIQAGTGTYGSRASVGLSAAVLSCDKIIAKGCEIVAHMLDVDGATVKFADGIFSSTATNRTVAFVKMVGAAHSAAAFPTDRIEPGLVATTFFDPPNFTYPAGVHVCEVEIDPDTGVAETQIGGKIAQMGARLVEGTAKSMADDFFGKFAAAVGEAGPEVTADPVPVPASNAAAQMPADGSTEPEAGKGGMSSRLIAGLALSLALGGAAYLLLSR